jgi:hypothetical protein
LKQKTASDRFPDSIRWLMAAAPFSNWNCAIGMMTGAVGVLVNVRFCPIGLQSGMTELGRDEAHLRD